METAWTTSFLSLWHMRIRRPADPYTMMRTTSTRTRSVPVLSSTTTCLRPRTHHRPSTLRATTNQHSACTAGDCSYEISISEDRSCPVGGSATRYRNGQRARSKRTRANRKKIARERHDGGPPPPRTTLSLLLLRAVSFRKSIIAAADYDIHIRTDRTWLTSSMIHHRTSRRNKIHRHRGTRRPATILHR